MKHKLFSMVALLAATCMSLSALAWTEPTMPEKPTDAGEFVVGGNYYVRMASCGQYLTGGNSWSTQISLTQTGMEDELNEPMILTIDSATATYSSVEVAGLSIYMNGSYVVNGASGTRTMSNTYFFRDSEASGFVDLASQQKGKIWNITKVGQYYRIQTAANDPTFPNAATQYAGWNSEGSSYDPETGWTMATTAVEFNVVPETEGFEEYKVDWEFVPADDYLNKKNAYSTRVELYNELLRADSLVQNEGLMIDYGAIGEVYNNENSTLEQLQSALSTLKSLINRAEFKKKWADASEDNPLDVTSDCLVNPDFSTGDISGWVCTFVKGTNCTNLGYQSASYDNTGGTCLSGEYGSSISQFIEAWTASGSFNSVVGDGTLQQTVYGMPAGKYVLHADINAVDQYQGNNPVNGVYLYIQAGEYEAKQAVATNNALPEHFSVTFINDGSDVLTFGLKTESCQANWIAADNFQIFYYGETADSPALATLKETIKTAEEVETETPANAQIKETFTNALDAAKDAISTAAGDEAYNTANTNLKAAMSALATSQKDYETLDALIDKVEATETQIAEQWPTLSDELATWREDTLQVAYDEGSYTAEDITAAESLLPQKIRNFIAQGGNVKEGDDLTLLIENADFSRGSGATNIPGWTIKSGAITELSATYHNIEAYHKQFDFAQTIANMPAGVYEVGVQGFVRLDDVSEPTMQLYAGASTNTFKLLTDEYSLYPFLGTTTDPETGKYTDSDSAWPNDTKHVGAGPQGEDIFVPNSMQGANNFFQETNPVTGQPFYLNTVKIVHTGGDLEIGVKCTSTGEWILWDNFTMKYAGNDISQYYTMIDDAAEKLEKVYNAEDAFITGEAVNQYNDVMQRVEEKEDLRTGDEALKLIADINAVVDYITAGNKAGAELKTMYSLYGKTLIDAVESSDESFATILGDIAGLIEDPSQIADNEAIPAQVEKLKKGWSKYCLFDGKNATEDTPWEQASSIILTPDYTDQVTASYAATYWNIENNVGSGNNYAADYAALECFNDSAVYVYQDLIGLYSGYYVITVEGFYRPGDYATINDSTAALHPTKVFALSSVDNYEVGMKNIVEGGQPEAIGSGDVAITTTATGTIYIPNNMSGASTYFASELYKNELIAQVGENGTLRIGIKKDKEGYITNDWMIFTGWRLSYIGTTAPTGIENINTVQAGKTQYYSINGMMTNGLQRGINIVRTTKADGSVETSKVIVK